MNTLNMTSFTAFIGIDWADAKHDICIQSTDSDESLMLYRTRWNGLMNYPKGLSCTHFKSMIVL